MSVSGIGGASAAPQPLQMTKSKGVDGPNDGDSDAGDAPKAQAAPASGTGLVVNKTA